MIIYTCTYAFLHVIKGGGAKIYLKREDLNHTGSHKINNAIGQILLARRMNKTHIIAETGAGQHGVATATVCSLFNIRCTIFMGREDIKRQSVNVEKMKLLGANIYEVTKDEGTLKEAVDEAFEYLLKNQDVFYLIGSAVGPSPYPEMVKHFQKIIGEEAKKQILEQESQLPKAIIACIGGGSNSIGLFTEFVKDKNVDIFGVEGAGKGLETGKHASAIYNNKVGILHGMKTYTMQDETGNVQDAYSISAGLDYPGIGPEHAYLKSIGRVKYDSITDTDSNPDVELLATLCFGLANNIQKLTEQQLNKIFDLLKDDEDDVRETAVKIARGLNHKDYLLTNKERLFELINDNNCHVCHQAEITKKFIEEMD